MPEKTAKAETLTLYPSRLASALIALASAAATVWLAIVVVRSPGVMDVLGLLVFALFLAGALFGILRPGAGAIVLSPEGYSTSAYLKQGVVVPWKEIERFYLGSLPGYRTRTRAILYRPRPGYLEQHPKSAAVLDLLGVDPMVPGLLAYKPNGRPLKKKQLVALLERWRKRYSVGVLEGQGDGSEGA